MAGSSPGGSVCDAGRFVVEAGKYGLWEKAEALFLQRVEQAADDWVAWQQLGELYRKQGKLSEAAEAFGNVLQLNACHPTAAHLQAILSGSSLPASSPQAGATPAPFVMVPNFLSATMRDRLMQWTLTHESAFKPLMVTENTRESERGNHDGNPGQPHYNLDVRRQLGTLLSDEMDQMIRTKLLECLPDALPRLQLEPFPLSFRRLEASVTLDGHFGRAHTDDWEGRYKISILYYFHQHPKSFDGGDLLLFDTDVVRNEGNPERFTRITHTDNLLLLFPCNYFHEVIRVHNESDAFENGRFAVAGFVEAA